jgi:uncharacterized membrane protein
MINRVVEFSMFLAVLAIPVAACASTYTFTPYNPPGLTSVIATGINDHGDIVGVAMAAMGGPCVFVDKGGQITLLFPPFGQVVFTAGINNNDDVVGSYFTRTTGHHGFLYHNGTFTTIDPGPPVVPGNVTLIAINDSGQILGNVLFLLSPAVSVNTYFVDTAGSFVFRSDAAQSLQNFSSTGMNNGGNVIGTEHDTFALTPDFPFYDDQIFVPNGALPVFAPFNAINNKGEIALGMRTVGPSYIMASATNRTVGQPISFPGATSTWVRGLNNSDQIVGTYVDSTGQTNSFTGTLALPIIEVTLDVDPDLAHGGKSDRLSLQGKSTFPVAILGSAQYDIYTFDPGSIRLGARGPGAQPVGQKAFADVNGDGLPDLILTFKPGDTGISCADTSVAIKGQTYGGQAFEGSSSLSALKLEPCPAKH